MASTEAVVYQAEGPALGRHALGQRPRRRREPVVEEGCPTAGDLGAEVDAQAIESVGANDMVLWVENHDAVASGDTLVDFGQGLEINPRWLRPGVTREQVADGLRPLLELPVEHVLAAHGGAL